jgi:hypothetical protein
VTVELVAPSAVIVFSTVTLQVTSYPAPVGKVGGLHWLTEGAVGAAPAIEGWITETVTVAATPPRITKAAAAHTASAALDERRIRPAPAMRINEVMTLPLPTIVSRAYPWPIRQAYL